jgi:hypothetical protein
MYRNKGILRGGGGGGGVIEYLPLLYVVVVGSHSQRGVVVTVASVVVVMVVVATVVVVVALAALRGGVGLGVVGRARVLGGRGRRRGGFSAGGHGDGDGREGRVRVWASRSPLSLWSLLLLLLRDADAGRVGKKYIMSVQLTYWPHHRPSGSDFYFLFYSFSHKGRRKGRS